MKIVVAQFYTPNITYARYSEDVNRAYCEKHGYTYVVEKDREKIYSRIGGIDNRHPTWYKPFLIEDIFENENPDWVLYLDADAAINDFDRKIEEFVDTRYNLVLSDDLGHHSEYNAGVILIKNSKWSRNFLKKWYNSAEIFDGSDAKELSIACLQDQHMQKKGVFKTVLWHDQTCLTLLAKDPEVKSKIKQISKDVFNHYELYQNNFIFHGYAKGLIPNRGLDALYKSLLKTHIKLMENNLPNINLVVYHSYAYGNYMELSTRQLERLKNSGLYDWADKVIVTHTDTSGNFDKFKELVSQYEKVELHTFIENRFESDAIRLIWDYSQNYNGKVCYFHTKGVFNSFTNVETKEISEWKVKGVNHWRELLEYYVIDRYTECVDKLDVVDQCGVSFHDGWWWGNFWWSNLDWIRLNERHTGGTRWHDEAWLNAGRHTPLVHEYFHMGYNPYFTVLPDDIHLRSYAKSNLKVTKAYYGTTGVQQDEGRPAVERTVVDVTEIVKTNVKHHSNKGINIFVHNGDFGDPIYGHIKTLVVHVEIEGKEYILAQQEGLSLNFFLQ